MNNLRQLTSTPRGSYTPDVIVQPRTTPFFTVAFPVEVRDKDKETVLDTLVYNFEKMICDNPLF